MRAKLLPLAFGLLYRSIDAVNSNNTLESVVAAMKLVC